MNMKDDFVCEWIKRAEQEKEGSVFQFVCYYIAFNHLYSGEIYNNGRSLKELDSLKKYIWRIMNAHKFNPYEKLLLDSELLNGVYSEKLNKRTSRIKLQNKDIEELFTSIYYVRCNLFHGSKSMCNDRNARLISDSCKVLCSLFNILND